MRRLVLVGLSIGVLLALLILLATPTAAGERSQRVAVLIYERTTVECQGTAFDVAMTPSMLALAEPESRAFAAKAAHWSGVPVEVSIERRPVLSSVTSLEPRHDCWPTTADVAPYPAGYDAVLVLWAAGPCSADVPGQCVNHRAGRASGTHGTALVPDGSAWSAETVLSDVMMHEWLHGHMDGEPPTAFPLPAPIESAPAQGAEDAGAGDDGAPTPVVVPPAPVVLPDTATADGKLGGTVAKTVSFDLIQMAFIGGSLLMLAGAAVLVHAAWTWGRR